MNKPKVRIGFIVINPNYQCEIERDSKGHWHTAKMWVKKAGLEEIFNEVRNNPENTIHDYDDFLTDYIGAIKLCATGGKLKCYVPRIMINKEYKSFLKRFYKSLGYIITGDVSNENDERTLAVYDYNQTVIHGPNGYMYNPVRKKYLLCASRDLAETKKGGLYYNKTIVQTKMGYIYNPERNGD